MYNLHNFRTINYNNSVMSVNPHIVILITSVACGSCLTVRTKALAEIVATKPILVKCMSLRSKHAFSELWKVNKRISTLKVPPQCLLKSIVSFLLLIKRLFCWATTLDQSSAERVLTKWEPLSWSCAKTLTMRLLP
jgi:hypothetical protein